ncbi:hypothetical protein A9498_31575 (plasmid) [Bacillus thuringiensis serovar coreanensis]|nr:hypothetical protein A9498_31575 [Bacillus thuringiensis serovar coreanensis]
MAYPSESNPNYNQQQANDYSYPRPDNGRWVRECCYLAYPCWGQTTVWFNDPSSDDWQIAYACDGGSGSWGELEFRGGSNAQGGSVSNALYRIRILSNNHIVQQGVIGQFRPGGWIYFQKYPMPNGPYVVEIYPTNNIRQFIDFSHRIE